MEETATKVINLQVAVLFWEDEKNGIMCSVAKPIDNISLENIKEFEEAIINNFQHPNLKLLADISDRKGFNATAREYTKDKEGIFKHFAAAAAYSDSKYNLTSMVINTFLKIIKPPIPLRIFHDRDEALKWLKSFHE